MNLHEWVKKVFGKNTEIKLNSASIADDVTEVYLKELAIATAINLIASTVSKCEFRTYLNGQPEKKEEYYLWNIQPNINQNSSDFIQKWITQLCYENEALIVEVNGQLYVADHFSVTEYALYDDVFTNVQIKNITLQRSFRARDVIYMKLNDQNVKHFLDASYTQYGKTIAHAIRSYLRSNVEKGIVNIDTSISTRKDFQNELQKLIDDRFKPFYSAESAVLPLEKGYSYTDTSIKGNAPAAGDLTERINYQFEMAGRTFKIPKSLMLGDVSDVKEITKNFLTFAIDPLTDKAGEEITRKRYGKNDYIKGHYLEINTNAIQHIDVFDMATAADKLLSSGIYCIDELRTKLGDVPLGTDWSQKHYITKNYAEASQLQHLGGSE